MNPTAGICATKPLAGMMRDYANKMDRQLTDLREERDRLKQVADALTAKLPRSLLE